MANETHTLKIGSTSYTLAPLWGNVQNRPTALSSFTNDSGFITASGSITGSSGSCTGNAATASSSPVWSSSNSITTDFDSQSNITAGFNVADKKTLHMPSTEFGSMNGAGAFMHFGGVGWLCQLVTGQRGPDYLRSGNSSQATPEGLYWRKTGQVSSDASSYTWQPWREIVSIDNTGTMKITHLDCTYHYSGGPTSKNQTLTIPYATSFSNGITGNVTGNCSGSSGSCTGNAATASSVAWTGVTGRPTALSQFTSDLGHTKFTGSLEIFSDGTNWSEGIRIHPSGGWSGIILCEAANSGSNNTSENTWSIHNNEGTFGIYKNGSNTSASKYISNVSGNWFIGGDTGVSGTLTVSSNLTVTGTISTTGGMAASNIKTGTFDAARIPSLAASKITSGTFDTARIPTNISITGSSGSCTGNAATASAVAWTGVTGRPTALSQFTNDSGFINNSPNSLEMMGVSSQKTPFIDFHHYDTASNDYDYRIICDGKGSTSVGQGTCSFIGNSKFQGTITTRAIATSSNGSYDIGATGTRFRYGYFSSSVYATSGFYESSDERLKNFGDKIPVDLEKISRLKKNYFKWKEDSNTDTQIGVSAQEIKEIYPELVTETEDGYLNVAYDKLSVVALAAVDELYKKNRELECRIQKLEEIVNNIIK